MSKLAPTPSRVFLVAALALGGWGGGAQAADAGGNYAVRGSPSGITCAQLQGVLQKGGAPLAEVIAWMDGVLTGVNMALPNTFDISPYRGGPFVQAMVLHICAQNPQLPVHAALFRVVNGLVPFRVPTDGPVAMLSVGGQNFGLSESAIRQVQEAMIQRGYLRPQRPDGRFTAAVRDALRRFQTDQRLPVTELPDLETLLRLFAR